MKVEQPRVSHRDLGHAARRGRDARQLELAEQVVVARQLPLPLENLNQDTRLVIAVGGEDLLLLGGDRGVARDEGRHHCAARRVGVS